MKKLKYKRTELQTKRIQSHKNAALKESNDIVDQTETSIKNRIKDSRSKRNKLHTHKEKLLRKIVQ